MYPTQPPALPSSAPSHPQLNPQPSRAQPSALHSSTPSPPQLNPQSSPAQLPAFPCAQEKTARVVCDTRVTACTDCEAIPRVMACIELWHASSYGSHRVAACTELLLSMSRFTLGCFGLEHVARHRLQKVTYTYKNCNFFNILC